MVGCQLEKWTPAGPAQHTRQHLARRRKGGRPAWLPRGVARGGIAEAAGFTRGAIYKHSTDKEDLFLAVNDRFNDRTLHAFTQLLDEQGSQRFPTTSTSTRPHDLATTLHPGPRLLHPSDSRFNLYLARNPEVRDRVVPRRHESAPPSRAVHGSGRSRSRRQARPADRGPRQHLPHHFGRLPAPQPLLTQTSRSSTNPSSIYSSKA